MLIFPAKRIVKENSGGLEHNDVGWKEAQKALRYSCRQILRQDIRAEIRGGSQIMNLFEKGRLHDN
jgi:hypothetical protein